jgi:hypothetical protein
MYKNETKGRNMSVSTYSSYLHQASRQAIDYLTPVAKETYQKAKGWLNDATVYTQEKYNEYSPIVKEKVQALALNVFSKLKELALNGYEKLKEHAAPYVGKVNGKFNALYTRVKQDISSVFNFESIRKFIGLNADQKADVSLKTAATFLTGSYLGGPIVGTLAGAVVLTEAINKYKEKS